MPGEPPRGTLQGQTRDNSNTRFFSHQKGAHTQGAQTRVFFHTKKEHNKYVFLYNMCRLYLSHHILFKGVCFVLS